MERLTADWDPERFPEVLDEEISKFLRYSWYIAPWFNALIVVGGGGYLIATYDKLTHANLTVINYFVVLVPLLLLSIAMVLVQYNSLTRQGEQAVEIIVRSGLIGRLPDAAGWISDVYQWTPPLVVYLALGERPVTMQWWARLLARNLDWYLQAPRRYIHRGIIYLALMAFLVVAGIPLLFFRFNTWIFFTGLLIGCLVAISVLIYFTFQLMKSRKTLQVFQQLLRSGGIATDQPQK